MNPTDFQNCEWGEEQEQQSKALAALMLRFPDRSGEELHAIAIDLGMSVLLASSQRPGEASCFYISLRPREAS